MLTRIGKGSWLLAAAVVIALGIPPQALAQTAKAESFAQKDQTLEYHFMLDERSLTEKDLKKTLTEKILTPLLPIADVESLPKPNARFYVDSRDRLLEKQKLIVRVRDGKITVKARATAPEVLLDLEKCSEKVYEMDFFETPEYSISSDIKFTKGEFDASPGKWTVPSLLGFMEKQCPAMMAQLRPAVKDGAGIEIPGAANIYGSDVALKHPLAKKAKVAGLAVWFFPPTDKALVELAFTGYVREKASLDKLYADLGKFLKTAGLLKAEQVSKTEQYFQAYFGR